MNIAPITLSGNRAVLLPISMDHAAGLLKSVRDPEVWRYMPLAPLSNLNDTMSFVQTALAEQSAGTALPFTIFDQHTNSIVGSTRFFDISRANRSGEIGWTWLDSSVWRTRINTECKYMLLRHCFETLGTIRVQLKADARNERSLRAMARIGAVREGKLRRHRILPDGVLRDSVYYSVIAEEWERTKAHLERLLDRQV